MDKTDNFSTDYTSQSHYQYLVDLRQECNFLLTLAEKKNDPEKKEEFKWNLKVYAREMEPKYFSRDKEKPDSLENDTEIEDLTLANAEKLLKDLNELMEAIGITFEASREYELNEKGAVKKE